MLKKFLLAASFILPSFVVAQTPVSLLKDFNTDNLPDIAPPYLTIANELFEPLIIDGKLIFLANDVTHGQELWKTDGTVGGTVMVRDVSQLPHFMGFGTGSAMLNGSVYFSLGATYDDGDELWKSDGTATGTMRVKDINPSAWSSPGGFFAFKDKVYFKATDDEHGRELWGTDGTEGGTRLVKDIAPGGSSMPESFIPFHNYFYFVAWDGTKSGVWRSDGTEEGTEFVTEINSSHEHHFAGVVNNSLIFTTRNISFEPVLKIWSIKESGEVELLKEIPDIFFGGRGIVYDDYIIVTGGYSHWRTDGTVNGTFLLGGTAGVPSGHQRIGDESFVIETYPPDRSLWKFNGNANSFQRVKDFDGVAFIADSPDIVNVQGKPYFIGADAQHGAELWTSDGTPAGTFMVADLFKGPGSSNIQNFFVDGDALYFTAKDSVTKKNQLWKMRAGELPKRLTDGDLDISVFVKLQNKMLLRASSPVYGIELFCYNISEETPVIEKSTQVITFGEIESRTFGDAPFDITATASSGLPVEFSVSPSGLLTINGNSVTMTGTGYVTITAHQSGSTLFYPATDVSQSFCIDPTKPQISVTNPSSATPTLTSSANEGNQWYLNNELIAGANGKTLTVDEAGSYSVVVNSGECTSDFSDTLVLIITSIDERAPENVRLYPNPTSNHFEVSGLIADPAIVEVIDITGRISTLLLQKDNDGVYHGETSHLTAGIYVLHVYAGSRSHKLKFIKK